MSNEKAIEELEMILEIRKVAFTCDWGGIHDLEDLEKYIYNRIAELKKLDLEGKIT